MTSTVAIMVARYGEGHAGTAGKLPATSLYERDGSRGCIDPARAGW